MFCYKDNLYKKLAIFNITLHIILQKHVADDFFLQAALAAGQGCESPVQGPCRRRRSADEQLSAVEQLSADEQLSAVAGISAQDLEERMGSIYTVKVNFIRWNIVLVGTKCPFLHTWCIFSRIY
jgi:hypothetical protein